MINDHAPIEPMTIAENASIYDVLPTLYAFVQSEIGHSFPSESLEDAPSRVECEALQKLINAIDLLIAIAPAITGR